MPDRPFGRVSAGHHTVLRAQRHREYAVFQIPSTHLKVELPNFAVDTFPVTFRRGTTDYHHGDLRVLCRALGDVLSLEFSGLMGASAMGRFTRALPGLAAAAMLIGGGGGLSRPIACVARIDRAILLMDASQLGALFDARPIDGVCRRATPMAIVGCSIDAPVLIDHTWNMAERGVVRAVFTDARLALAWAQARRRYPA